MITKRDFILRGSCFCENYNLNVSGVGRALSLEYARLRYITLHTLLPVLHMFTPDDDCTILRQSRDSHM